jgi:hypothetical protein
MAGKQISVFDEHEKRTRARSFSNLRAILLRKIEIAVGTMKIHPRAQHVGMRDKNLLAFRTRHLNSLAHDLPHIDFRF